MVDKKVLERFQSKDDRELGKEMDDEAGEEEKSGPPIDGSTAHTTPRNVEAYQFKGFHNWRDCRGNRGLWEDLVAEVTVAYRRLR